MGMQILRRAGQPYWTTFLDGLAPRRSDRPLSSEEQLEERRLQLQASFSSIRASAALGLVAAIAVSLLMAFWDLNPGRPFMWLALLVLGLLHALWLVAREQVLAADEAAVEALARALVFNGAYCGVIWGMSSWLMLPAATPEGETFLVIVAAMVFVGGGSSSAYRPVDMAFVLPGVAAFGLGLVRLGGTYQMFLGAAFLMLGLLILRFTRTQHDASTMLIRLGMETRRLLKERTEQQAVAESLRQQAETASERAQAANQAKTAFLAAAGHDLRQPMHALVQYHAHLRRRNADRALDDTIDRIGKSLDAMQDLLDSMLEASKLLTGSVRPIVRCFESADLFDRLDAQLRPVAEDKGLRFIVEPVSCVLETDDVLLERILRNLTLNAIRYTPRGQVRLRARRRGRRLRLQVWDTGIGISKADQARIFDEFYQVANEARDRRKGLGLGLALVRQMGELLGYRIRWRSTPGRGSVFMVDVPLGTAAPRADTQRDVARRPDFVRGASIVLIDDNAASLEATAQTLREFGAHVLTACSGAHAIDRLLRQEFAPQMVISDFRLEQGETGVDAVAMVIENQRALFGDEFEIAALLISGDTAPRELLTVKNAGYDMLHKPLRPLQLYDAVNARLQALARGE